MSGAYYAAQVGIGARAKDSASRSILSALLGTLESLKNAIGANDAIDIEAASSAYVENFALRVFNGADDEDRKGAATRYAIYASAQIEHLSDIYTGPQLKSFLLRPTFSKS